MRPYSSDRSRQNALFQSTHPRGVRLCGSCGGSSIGDFNPRTREGCDTRILSNVGLTDNFNPRTREGCDDFHEFCRDRSGISIHAPARGATTAILIPPFAVRFQSTHPRGVRPYVKLIKIIKGVISIHAPARGATSGEWFAFNAVGISIHAPARGATGAGRIGALHTVISIHAPARGATRPYVQPGG